jgi:acetyl esterase
MVYFQGGGWVTGDLAYSDELCRHLAHDTGCVVVSVGYRLAPEHPFPTPFTDAYAALVWAADAVAAGGPLAVGGDSAGGNLAAAVALHCRDTQRPLVAQLLVYPAVDLAGGLAAPGDDGFFTGQDDWVERQYLGDDLGRARDARVSPLHAESHAGLAPAVIGIGHHDPLLAQNLAYAAALRAAGVPTVVREYPELVHGFFGMGAISAGAEKAADELCRDLRDVVVGN